MKSSIFVGRKEELKRFEDEFLFRPGTFILNIHTKGDGGVGKTQLLLKMLNLCHTKYNKKIITNAKEELIDLYHTENRSRAGIIKQIIKILGDEHFFKTKESIESYLQPKDSSDPEYFFQSKVLKKFREEYRLFADNAAWNKKNIVLFFDTYEAIQIQIVVKKEKKRNRQSFPNGWKKTSFPFYIHVTRSLLLQGAFRLLMSQKMIFNFLFLTIKTRKTF